MNINYKSNQENMMNRNNGSCNTVRPGENQSCVNVATQRQSITEQLAVSPVPVSAGPLVIKIPVVLAETNITIPVEAVITLDQVAMEIKRIKKNVYLTQSRLIPFSQDNRKGTGMLFIEGFVRKNIEYATQTCPTCTSSNVCGEIRHCTVEVPFNFTTRVNFLREPIFNGNTTPRELQFFTDKLQGCDSCSDSIIGRNPCDQSFFFTEVFNEKPFVELVRADITEIDIHTNPTVNCETPTEQRFTQLTEKIVINLTLKVLQNQQVRVASLA